MKTRVKIGLCLLFSAAFFIITAASLRVALIVKVYHYLSFVVDILLLAPSKATLHSPSLLSIFWNIGANFSPSSNLFSLLAFRTLSRVPFSPRHGQSGKPSLL
jgi:hypothetical protein